MDKILDKKKKKVKEEDNLINKNFEENRKRQGLTYLIPTTPGELLIEEEEKNKDDSFNTLIDKSRKGSVDERVVPIVQKLNCSDNFFTTSSCSGRFILYTYDNNNDNLEELNKEINEEASSSASTSKSQGIIGKKKGCVWLFTTHDEVDCSSFIENCWRNLDLNKIKYVVLKVEPAILHVQCRTLFDTKKLIHAATESGFRNSGVVIGKDNNMTVAIRSTLSMEIPLPLEDETMKNNLESFFPFWIKNANEKLNENWKRTEKLYAEISKIVS